MAFVVVIVIFINPFANEVQEKQNTYTIVSMINIKTDAERDRCTVCR